MKTLTPMNRVSNQMKALRVALKAIGFKNTQLNKAKGRTFESSPYEPYMFIEKRQIVSDYVELFQHDLPESRKFMSLGISFTYQNVETPSIKISCMKLNRTHLIDSHNSTEAVYESKELTIDELATFLKELTALSKKENTTYKEVFSWLHANYNHHSYINIREKRKKECNVVAY